MKSNIHLQRLIADLQKMSLDQNVRIWKRIASDLSKSTRSRHIVNIMNLSQHTKEADTVVVPGKVLGNGEISHALTVAAWNFSNSAKEKLEKSGSTVLSISELLEKNPKGSKVRILA